MFRQTLRGAGCLDQHVAPRRHASLVRRSGLLSAITVATSLTAAAPALADSATVDVEKIHPPFVFVENDGKNYTGIAGAETPITADVRYRFDTHGTGKLKGFSVWLQVRAEDTDWIKFKQHGYSRTYRIGDRPNGATDVITLALRHSDYANLFTSYCNRQAQFLRNQGLSNQQVFSEDRQVLAAVYAERSYDMSGSNDIDTHGIAQGFSRPTWDDFRKITVVCKGTPVDLDPVTPAIADAALSTSVSQTHLHDACDLKLSGTITSEDPNTEVKFRYVDEAGLQSALKTVTTGADRKAVFTHNYPLDPAGKTSGKIRMVGYSPPFFSNWADYDADCVALPQGEASLFPPRATHLEAIATPDRVTVGDHICPARVELWGIIEGRGTVRGEASFLVNGKVAAAERYRIEDGEQIVFRKQFPLTWIKRRFGQFVPTKEVRYTMNVKVQSKKLNVIVDLDGASPIDGNSSQAVGGGDDDNGAKKAESAVAYNKVVDQMEVVQEFVCEKIETAALSGLPSQMIAGGDLAATKTQQQVSLSFAILAPRNTVRNGQIRLSGVATDQVFRLSFQRKANGIYKTVHPQTAQVPHEMTGAAASFSTDSMEPGNWRLRVCPIRPDGQIAQGNDCRQSDFVVAKTATFGGLPGAAKGKGGPGQKTPNAPEPQTFQLQPVFIPPSAN